MNSKYGYCKAIDKKTGRTVEGYFAIIPFCTYCMKEDYEAHPDNDREYVVHYQSGDWGLPNTPILTEIVPMSMKRYIGEDKNGRKVFEKDIVHFQLTKDLDVNVMMFFGEWKRQVYSRNEDYVISMNNEERSLWLCDGELVLEEE